MKYAATVARLEKLVGKGRCPLCRLLRRQDRWPDPARPEPPPGPALFVTKACDACGALLTVSLAPYGEGLRPMMRLALGATAEDTFTDPRARAARRWRLFWAGAAKAHIQARLAEAHESKGAPGGRPVHAPRGRAQRLEGKLRARLEREAEAAQGRIHKRLRERYGENPFPDVDARIAAVKSPDYFEPYDGEPFSHYIPFEPMSALQQEADLRLKCAEAERVALGEVLPYTAQALADCERRAQELVAHARQKHEEREATRPLETEKRRNREPSASTRPQAFKIFQNLSRARGRTVGDFTLGRRTVEVDNVLNAAVYTFAAEFINFNGLRPTATPAQRRAFLDGFLVPTRTLRPRSMRLGVRLDF